MKIHFLFFLLIPLISFSQVTHPHNSPAVFGAERVSNFTVSGAGNDRLEIANGTMNDGQFIPTFWSYRDSSNSFSMVFTSAIANNLDNGTSPMMLFTAGIPTQIFPGAPGTGDFIWGPAGTTNPVANRPLFQWRNASSKLMTIVANGNVGVGVENPTALFHTLGSVRFEGLANNTSPAYMLGTDINGNVFEFPVPSGGTGANDFDWLRPDNTFATSINDNIYTNGFVGFNVQNPEATIHTSGALKFESLPNGSDAVFMLGTDVEGNVLEFPVPSGAGNPDMDWVELDGSMPDSIDEGIYRNGKVGINVNTFPTTIGSEDVSSYNLFVAGGILTEEVRVALVDEWADYVFKEDYKLPTLNEVEQHIKEKGHLKNIPSEAKVKEDGIELAEMNKLLLEKVEELTLYVIDLNKKLEEQQKEIEKLKRKR